MQWIKSLFTTASVTNPLSIVVYGGFLFIGLYGYHEIRILQTELSMARQTRVVQGAARERLETLNEARNEQQQANIAIDNDDFIEWLDRMQRDD